MIGRFNSLLCFERFDDPFSMLATGLRQKLTKQRFKVFWLTLSCMLTMLTVMTVLVVFGCGGGWCGNLFLSSPFN